MCFGRLVPGVRTPISVPARLAATGLRRFLLFTAAGTVLWTSLLAAAGWRLGANYEAVSAYLGPVSNVVVGAIVLWYLRRVASFGRSTRRNERR